MVSLDKTLIPRLRGIVEALKLHWNCYLDL